MIIDGVRMWVLRSLSDSDYSRLRSNLKNLHATRNEGGISIRGSLAEFLHGEALTQPSIDEYRSGVAELGEIMSVQASEIKMLGLEYGPNITLDSPVARYLDLFEKRSRIALGNWTNSGVKTLQYGDS